MDLIQQLLKEHSRSNADLITKWVGTDKNRFKQVYILFKSKEVKLAQRAAWIVKNALLLNSGWVPNYSNDLILLLREGTVHNGIIRHILNIFDGADIPKKNEGDLMEICFEKLLNSKSEIAVKVNSMSILAKMSLKYPEIKVELVSILQMELEKGATPAIRSRAKNILKTIES